MPNYKELMKHINTFIFDYDGVLTDGNVILVADGDALRTANVKDGYALQLAVKSGYNVAIISGGRSQSMVSRFQALKITDYFLGVDDKLALFRNYLEEKKVKPGNALYMGDDIPDFRPMKEAGLPCCPADASPEIKAISLYISPFNGGGGCVRDVVEQTLKVQDSWMNNNAFLW
jgi:3-deoxy-D-manno-octulosonate 8-phosphate phosphatase (KDO 8-P phosphatase)